MTMSTNRSAHLNAPHSISSAEEEMQRQMDEFSRSVTIVIWYKVRCRYLEDPIPCVILRRRDGAAFILFLKLLRHDGIHQLTPFLKANVEPIRLHQTLATFPYFQLSRFNELIDDLGLTTSSYLDTYIPAYNKWEIHPVTTTRIVETQQRLLYRVRRSLMEGLLEEECSSLREELQMQTRNGRPHPPSTVNAQPSSSTTSIKAPQPQPSPKTNDDSAASNNLKRPAPQTDTQEARQSPKIHVTNGYYLAHTGSSNTIVPSPVAGGPSASSASTSNVTSPQSSAQGQDNNVYMYQNPVFYGGSSGSPSSADTSNTLPHYLLTPQASAPPIPYHPHPPLKRWPNDYTVSELSAGFHAMDLLISQSPTGASMTQRTAFERVFGSRYVKSTVCRHRAVWRKAPRLLREQFEQMGTDDRACWGEFVRRVENRPPGKHSNIDMMSPASSSLGYHEQQNTPEDEDVHGQESVMGSMQSQVSSTTNGNAMQNNLNVYDPSRNHIANGGHNG
ncbi:hypothetical protein GALMADRAFT_229712 [Galerina marginata CBS 339.88]|uniref:Uncharacterized protein n=1 Tax=Galerina marginata (strain CBS 339.88) TaxID=685588 RepID=A0A067SJJ2_GALM3|nr:hypothetical protein GALMADRAFT_229712 [Galerina marginata CBS 339.88]